MLATQAPAIQKIDVKKLACEFNDYFAELEKCFVGKEKIIRLLKYALAQRQHILLFGPPGTSKTLMCDTAFANIEHAKKFRTELSLFMSEDALFGPYDTKKMREEGVLEHRTEEMLPEANLARIGEFLDGSTALLRTLLGPMNERQFRRGRQILDIPLYTVYCDTNIDPGDYLKKNPHSWAILDRILFMSHIEYLDTAEDISKMLFKFQGGETVRLKKTLSLETITTITSLVISPPSLITNVLVMTKLAEAMQEYRERRKHLIEEVNLKVILPEISDRRLCYASQMLEVEAVLSGRLTVEIEDLRPVHYVLGTTPEEEALWLEIVERKIIDYRKETSNQLVAAQNLALTKLYDDIQIAGGMANIEEAAHHMAVYKKQFAGINITEEALQPQYQKVDLLLKEITKVVGEKLLKEKGLVN